MGKKRRPDPFADYIEWTQNRFNPGHYLGGNIPPDLNKSYLGRRGRRLMGIYLIASAVAGVLMLATIFDFGESSIVLSGLLPILVVALTFFAGVEMLRSSRGRMS